MTNFAFQMAPEGWHPGMPAPFPVPNPMRPSGTPIAPAPTAQPSGPEGPTVLYHQRMAPEGWRPGMPVARPGQVAAHGGSLGVRPLPNNMIRGISSAPVQRSPIYPANRAVPSRVRMVPRGSVRSQLSRGPRPGRSTAFHDYTGSSVGSESGHYARVKGFTS